jgi:hypothetical protein
LNFNDIELYAGFADARLQVDAFHFGHGIALSRTFAHLSAPFLAGFLPRPPRDSSWLLDARMASLEGATEGLEEPLGRTYALAKRALVRIFESGWVPTLREMESGHLGPH